MDAEQALADLMEVSSQVEAAVVLDAAGELLASTLPSAEATESFVAAVRGLLPAVADARAGTAAGEPTQLEVALEGGSVFVAGDGARTVAAVTDPEPTAGLVFYDLRTALRALTEDDAAA